MLTLSRKAGEEIVIGDNIVVRIRDVDGNRVSIGIEAPKEMPIRRGELQPEARGSCDATDGGKE